MLPVVANSRFVVAESATPLFYRYFDQPINREFFKVVQVLKSLQHPVH